MEQNTININELERLAKALGGAEWSFDVAIPENGVCAQVWDGEGNDLFTAGPTDEGSLAVQLAAAVCPAAILSLIDRLRKAEAERDALAAKLKELEGLAERYRVLLSNIDHTQPVNAGPLEALKVIVERFGPIKNELIFSKRLAISDAEKALAAAEARQAEPVRFTRESVARAQIGRAHV